MLNCHTLLFDLDNTLFDRDSAMRQAMIQWLQTHPDASHTLEEIMERDNSGYGDRNVFCNWLLPTADPGIVLRNIQQQLITCLAPDPIIPALLGKLKEHYQLVLASNGSGAVQRNKLAACGLTDYFEHVFISGEMGKAKPDPLFFTGILDTLALTPAQTIMIGDDPVNDIPGAQQCGIKTCWISHGRPVENITPDIIIQHVTELYQWTEC